MGFIGNIIYSTVSSKEKVEKYQQLIRDTEWASLENEIANNCSFLDVGCGAGYAMFRAFNDKNCDVVGLDPSPGAHGVGRYIKNFDESNIKILKGVAESLPFENETFDIIFSSHVLEHVNNEDLALKEMNRVLKNDGRVIIGMPTATMAFIQLFSELIFLTHIKIYNLFRHPFSKDSLKNLKSIFIYNSHSYPRATTIFYDLKHYRIKNWTKIVSTEFDIVKIIRPCLYPFPNYPQWFSLTKSKNWSSSVFFVCKKKIE